MLKATAVAAAGFTIVPRHVLGGPGYTAPSDQLTRAIIGVGGMGKGHINYEGAKLVALCDVDRKHVNDALQIATEKFGPGIKTYGDFREVLDRPDIDIVHIPTPPHWHAYISVAAARAGKDIWCEKPMVRTMAEGKKVVEAVQKNGRIFRINTWFRFHDDWHGCGSTARPLKKIVDSGILGWPLKITLGKSTGFDWKFDQWSGRTDLKPQPVPTELDYDMWLGPAPFKPYNEDRVHGRFRGYWDYDGGGLGDMGQHYLDPPQYLLGKDETSPVEIEAEAHQQHPDAVGSFQRIWMRYADGCELILDGSEDKPDQPFIQGPKGTLFKNLKSDIPDFDRKLSQMPDITPMNTDFITCVKTRTKFALNESNGHRSCMLINMAKIAMRLGRKLNFDPETQVFINDDEANRMMDEPARAPWTIV